MALLYLLVCVFYAPSYYKKDLLTLSCILKCCLLAKLCLIFGNRKDCSLPGSSVRGVSQAKILVWLPFSSRDLPDPGIKPMSPALRADCHWGLPWCPRPESSCNARAMREDLGSIPGWGSSPGEGNGNPLQCLSLENSMDRAAWRGYSPWDHKQLDVTEPLTHTHTHTHTVSIEEWI